MTKGPIVARITELAARDSEASCWFVQPRDAIFDVCSFNATEGTNYRPIPAAHRHGVAIQEATQPELIFIDQCLLGQQTVQVWNGEALVDYALKDLAGGNVSNSCVPLVGSQDRRPPRLRINQAVSDFTDLRIQQRLDETLDIPPLPEAARRIVALQSNPNFDLSELVSIVETDPSIAAKIMSWANSAFYAADPPARSLDDAIMRILGFDLVMNLALGLVLSGTLRMPDSHVNGAPPVWTQSVFTAAATEAIGRKMQGNDSPAPGSCYLTGLLSNFGTLVLGHVFPPQYRSICQLQEANPHLPTNVLDEHVLKIAREEICATLFEQWGLPGEIISAIRHQNTPDYSGAHATWVNLLQLANQMLKETLVGSPTFIEEHNLEVLGLQRPDLYEVADLLETSQTDLEAFARAVA